jgi:hypothetical protein
MLWREGRVAISAVLALTLVFEMAPGVGVARAAESEEGAIGATPPRLSYVDGEVSYFRPGAQDWAPAQVNTPLAPGDELYTGNRGNLELQVGARAFVRAWGDSQLGLVNQEPDFLQIKVTAGHVALDLRNVDPGRTVEIDTPQAAFTIERPGYYRVDVTQNGSSFVTRRSGQATMTPAGGQAVAIAASEEVVLEGAETPTVRSYVAPELDVWDRWNYARTDDLIDAISSRYVPAGVYGVDDLDHYGDWRVVPTYGSVWVPQSVPADWAPYSTGRWVMDPHYGWTWVDTAPWGWAPYHYGRWVFVSGYWAWAPGPVIVRPVYAPALVAFFGTPSVRVAIGVPGVSWVALSWGEPLVPWWGRPHFVGRPTWVGWGGPRFVNNVVVNRTTVVNVTNINVYRNTNVQHAVVAVREDHFGRGPVQQARIAQVDARRLEPARTPVRVAPDASSYVAASGHATRPPDHTITRAVVATRAPRREGPGPADAARVEGGRDDSQRGEGSRRHGPRASNGAGAPPPRIVPAPRAASVPARPTLGNSEVERQRPPQPRQFGAPDPPESARGQRDRDGQRPDGNAQRPNGNAQRRDGNNTQRPEGNVQRPDNTQRPNANVQRPVNAPRSDNAPRPDNAQRPDNNGQRPDGSSRRPDSNAQRPDGATRRPDTNPVRPDGNTPPRPDGNVQRSAPGPSGPRDGARGQRPAPPPQAQQQAPRPERVEGRGPQQQRLPGEPANRISPERAERRQQPEGQPQERPQPQERRGGGGGGKDQPGR